MIISKIAKSPRVLLPKGSDLNYFLAPRNSGMWDQKLRQGYLCAEDDVCIATIRNEPNGHPTVQPASSNGHRPSSPLDAQAIAWIQEVLSQKFYIGVEQADTRRFRANSWSDCGVIKTMQEEEAIATVAQLLQHYPHQYVRLFSINPKTRQRGNELIVQHAKQR